MEILCGIDEAGRGPLAGPVVASSVILPPNFQNEFLADSKKLSEKKRILAEEEIKKSACYGIGIVSHKEIDSLNILNASLLAMKLSFENMIKTFPEWIVRYNFNNIENIEIRAIADGTFCPEISCKCECKIKADATFYCVMAASILAKNERDRIMLEMDKLYPEYGYARHKGYPTKE
ncbi:MAG: ribonuclease HII, partial [Treponema sp.]|nr:ribonuclease HII [Treponema sp.]